MSDRTYSIPPAQASLVKSRIMEANVWCAQRARRDDPKHSLRSPELRPRQLFWNDLVKPDGQIDTIRVTTDERCAMLEELCKQRATLLRREGLSVSPWPPNPGAGRLLMTYIDYSMWEALSEDHSKGYVDAFDVSPWDTWIDLRSTANSDVLLSWVPQIFIGHVNDGIFVNCVDCFGWVERLLFS